MTETSTDDRTTIASHHKTNDSTAKDQTAVKADADSTTNMTAAQTHADSNTNTTAAQAHADSNTNTTAIQADADSTTNMTAEKSDIDSTIYKTAATQNECNARTTATQTADDRRNSSQSGDGYIAHGISELLSSSSDEDIGKTYTRYVYRSINNKDTTTSCTQTDGPDVRSNASLQDEKHAHMTAGARKDKKLPEVSCTAYTKGAPLDHQKSPGIYIIRKVPLSDIRHVEVTMGCTAAAAVNHQAHSTTREAAVGYTHSEASELAQAFSKVDLTEPTSRSPSGGRASNYSQSDSSSSSHSSPQSMVMSPPDAVFREPSASTIQQYVGVNNTAPPIGVNNTAPPIGVNNTAPPIGVNNAAPPIGVNNTAPPIGVNNAAPPIGVNNAAPPIGVNNAAPPTELQQQFIVMNTVAVGTTMTGDYAQCGDAQQSNMYQQQYGHIQNTHTSGAAAVQSNKRTNPDGEDQPFKYSLPDEPDIPADLQNLNVTPFTIPSITQSQVQAPIATVAPCMPFTQQHGNEQRSGTMHAIQMAPCMSDTQQHGNDQTRNYVSDLYKRINMGQDNTPMTHNSELSPKQNYLDKNYISRDTLNTLPPHPTNQMRENIQAGYNGANITSFPTYPSPTYPFPTASSSTSTTLSPTYTPPNTEPNQTPTLTTPNTNPAQPSGHKLSNAGYTHGSSLSHIYVYPTQSSNVDPIQSFSPAQINAITKKDYASLPANVYPTQPSSSVSFNPINIQCYPYTLPNVIPTQPNSSVTSTGSIVKPYQSIAGVASPPQPSHGQPVAGSGKKFIPSIPNKPSAAERDQLRNPTTALQDLPQDGLLTSFRGELEPWFPSVNEENLKKSTERMFEQSYQHIIDYSDGDSMLHVAVSTEDYVNVKAMFVAHGALLQSLIDKTNDEKQTPLLQAVTQCYVDMVRILISHGADVNLSGPASDSTSDDSWLSPVQVAVQKLENPCDAYLALKIIHLLVDRKTLDVNQGAISPLNMAATIYKNACQGKHHSSNKYIVEDAIICLVKHGANLNAQCTRTGATPFQTLVCSGEALFIRRLLDTLPRTAVPDTYAYTTEELSLQSQESVTTARDRDDNSCLHYAAGLRKDQVTLDKLTELITLLIERGANIHTQNRQFYAPLKNIVESDPTFNKQLTKLLSRKK